MPVLKKDIVSVIVVTVYLAVYCVLLQFEVTMRFAVWMQALSPIAIIWMVVQVLTQGTYNGRELGEEEFGYQDKEKDDLGVF